MARKPISGKNSQSNATSSPVTTPSAAQEQPVASRPAAPAPETKASSIVPATAPAATFAAPKPAASAEVNGSTAVETKSAPEARKLEVVKTDARKNVVVPIKLDDEIRRRAYEIYQHRGNASGSEAEDWLAAEREVRERYQQQSA